MREMLRGLRDQAARTCDPQVWHYLNRGAGENVSVDEAADAWSTWRLRPHVLRDVSHVSTELSLFGQWRTPIGVAPTAFHRLVHADGELATARAAAHVGSPMVLSSRATTRIKEVAAAIGGPWWFQVYSMRDRKVTEALALRAARAGASALVLTGDTPYVGYRSAGIAVRPLPMSDDLALVNVREHLTGPVEETWDRIDQRPDQTVADIRALAELTGLPVIVKGVLRGDDAQEVLAAGASGVWVSNHGGRQLDRAVPTAQALPEVVAAIGGSAPVIADGGIRSGFDALTALALGADAVFVGRPVLWGLGADGADGVQAVLSGLTDELEHAMGLAGVADLRAVDQSLVAAG